MSKNKDTIPVLTCPTLWFVLLFLLLPARTLSEWVSLVRRLSHSRREPVDEVLQIPPSLLTCGGCQQNIGDRYFLKAIDQYWHEDCLSCDLCGCRLGEVGRRLYYKLGRKLCRRDYLRYASHSSHPCPPPSHRLLSTARNKEFIWNGSHSLAAVTGVTASASSGLHYGLLSWNP